MSKKKKASSKKPKEKKEPDWLQFEKAVAEFVKTLDPSAQVTHNAKLPDRHTNRPRQRDIWIESSFGGHFPIKILVSCKRYKRKLSQKDIDDFNGELVGAGRPNGVLYSYSGFSPEAIEKAKVLGISCCRLYQHQPADLPESLIIRVHYTCQEDYIAGIGAATGFTTWGQLLCDKMMTSDGERPVIDGIVETMARATSEMPEVPHAPNEIQFPPDVRFEMILRDDNGKEIPLMFERRWKFYKANEEAVLLDGSYSVTDNTFRGTQYGPIIDTQGATPGPAWTLLDGRPPKIVGSGTLARKQLDFKRWLTCLAQMPLPQPEAQ